MQNQQKSKKNPEISVIICTKDRPHSIKNCLDSLLNSTFKPFEIILVDQSTKNDTRKMALQIKNLNIRYIKARARGLGYARNVGIAAATAPILAFTDDDCIVQKDWLACIFTSFSENSEIDGVFGKTKPYQSHLHVGNICPCTFTSVNDKEHVIQKPGKHWEHIGFGNNMAFKKSLFTKVGGFNVYMGAGSIGKSAEDAEFSLRVLVAGKKLFYSPHMQIAHDRWMTEVEMKRQNTAYVCGEVICYGYFALFGERFAQKVVLEVMKDVFYIHPKKYLLICYI